MPKPPINELIINVIKATGNPAAPLILENLYSALSNTRHVFPCSMDNVNACQQRLMQGFPDNEELNVLATQPEFITALIIMLQTSLVHYGSDPLSQYQAKSKQP